MKKHVVCIPFPSQGHIRPMLKLAQLLHFNFGFNITFINTHHIHQTYFKNQSSSSSSSTNKSPFFKFESFPQRLDNDDNPNDLVFLINSIANHKFELPLKELLKSNVCTSSFMCWMISDIGMSSFTLKVAQELGILCVLLETVSACAHLAYFHSRQLLDEGILPLSDKSYLTNGYLEKVIDGIPSMKGICLKDMPTFIRTTDPNDMLLNITVSNAQRAINSQAIILINTFDALEQDVLSDLSTMSPNIYPIGPLHLMVEQHISRNDDDDIISIGPTILCEQEDDKCMMKWLDSQEPKSVLYVSFGTIVSVTQETLMELAWGLAYSHINFLWIIRFDLVNGERDCVEFDRFKKEIDGRGVLASWCDQERVMNHSSIGGFLTHCGWNSMIESISNGVPMICWPFVVEQVTNAWYCCNALGIGVKIDEVERDVIERTVKELMHKDKGKEIMAKAMEWRKLAIEAIMNPQGSSYVNLRKVVDDVLKIHDNSN